ncbi:MAG: UPF0182 family protein, partial [Acidobacteriaceae bacterium]|nr:UPF0182 family protein [Acidobacteriaceae bacterium]
MPDLYIGESRRRRTGLFVIVLVIVLLLCSRYIASTLIDYSWWSELGQVDTWLNLLLYGTVPVILVALLFWAAFWTAFRLGIRHQTHEPLMGFIKWSLISRIAALVFLVIAVIAANATVDNWTVVRYFGGLRLPAAAGEFIEPIFHRPLHFYFFGLPFYNMILHVVITGAVLVLLIYWLASNVDTLTAMRTPTGNPGTEFQTPLLGGRTFNSTFVRLAAALLLVGLAIKFFFNRYNLLFEDHGLFLVGVDWVADHIVL